MIARHGSLRADQCRVLQSASPNLLADLTNAQDAQRESPGVMRILIRARELPPAADPRNVLQSSPSTSTGKRPTRCRLSVLVYKWKHPTPTLHSSVSMLENLHGNFELL